MIGNSSRFESLKILIMVFFYSDCIKETDEDSMQTKTSSSSVSESEQKAEILQQLSGRSVEESCIIVDRDELHCVFPDKEENDKRKPYKVLLSFSLRFTFAFIINF